MTPGLKLLQDAPSLPVPRAAKLTSDAMVLTMLRVEVDTVGQIFVEAAVPAKNLQRTSELKSW